MDFKQRATSLAGTSWHAIGRGFHAATAWIVEAIRKLRSVRVNLVIAVLLTALGLLAFGACAWWLIGFALTGNPTYSLPKGAETRGDATRIALTIVAGLGGAVALVVTFRKQRRAEDGSFLERLSIAADLLGGANPTMQVSGIYALAALADETHGTQRQQCIDVLCSYMRLPYSPTVANNLHPATTTTRRTYTFSDRTTEVQTTINHRPSDGEVRLTIIDVIRQHLQPEAMQSWSKNDFNFRESVFDGGSLAGALFQGAVDFTGATFIRRTMSFSFATFSGKVNFGLATFSGRVDFSDAWFSGGTVNFLDALFTGGTVDFRRARFSGGTVQFSFARFAGGSVSFARAMFTGSNIDFLHTKFSGGEVDFNEAMFSGGEADFSFASFSHGTVNFARTEFTGGTMIFIKTEFTGGNVNFAQAEFSGGDLRFGQAKFAGGKMRFGQAKFSGGKMHFFQAEFTGGELDFGSAEFTGGELDFGLAEFTGSTLDFRLAKFTSGKVNFFQAEFTGGELDFGSAEFTGSNVDFRLPSAWKCPPLVPWDIHPPEGVVPQELPFVWRR
ncbi:pentapeptide repeat-containing protein [Micrococcaceae bacterium Sec5.7]